MRCRVCRHFVVLRIEASTKSQQRFDVVLPGKGLVGALIIRIGLLGLLITLTVKYIPKPCSNY